MLYKIPLEDHQYEFSAIPAYPKYVYHTASYSGRAKIFYDLSPYWKSMVDRLHGNYYIEEERGIVSVVTNSYPHGRAIASLVGLKTIVTSSNPKHIAYVNERAPRAFRSLIFTNLKTIYAINIESEEIAIEAMLRHTGVEINRSKLDVSERPKIQDGLPFLTLDY